MNDANMHMLVLDVKHEIWCGEGGLNTNGFVLGKPIKTTLQITIGKSDSAISQNASAKYSSKHNNIPT